MERLQRKQILKDLEKKMVFITGPRQVGKTWLAKEVAKHFEHSVYLNYDSVEDRAIIKKEEWPLNTELLVLDELHKMRGWKNFLKGVYDTKNEKLKILVTGSARLETFRQSGDSLAGRFFLHRLLPFSLVELVDTDFENRLDLLISRGGFPEPLLAQNDEDADRWRTQYIDGLVRTDILSFESIRELNAIKTIFELLRRKVGSSISYSSLARDAEISPATTKKYISILEALFIIFRVTPHSKKIARSILKEPKVYFFDTGLVVGDSGTVFENFVAVSLYKHILAQNDQLGKSLYLKFVRTKDGKEVDFAIVNEGQEVLSLVEAKVTDKQLSKTLDKFSKQLKVESVQLVRDLKRERQITDTISIQRATNYLSKLFL